MVKDANSNEVVVLNLVYDSCTEEVMYAYADKCFVDILLSYLTLPLGTIATLVQQEESSVIGKVDLGCVTQIRESLESLTDTHLCNGVDAKQVLLHPVNVSEIVHYNSLTFKIDDTQSAELFMCSQHPFITTSKNSSCIYCANPLHQVLPSRIKDSSDGFVNGGCYYIIKDDLTVLPFSPDTSCVRLFKEKGQTNTRSLKERVLMFTKTEMNDFFKCCLLSKSPLTTFLKQSLKQDIHEHVHAACDYEYDFEKDLNMPLKLLLNKSDGSIILANATEDFAELLVSFLTFPLGSVVKKLECNTGLGSIDTLYKSVFKLDEEMCLSSKSAMNYLVDPLVAHNLFSDLLLLPCDRRKPEFYYYSNDHPQVLSNLYYITRERKLDDKGEVKKMLFVQKSATENTENSNRILKGPSMYLVHPNLMFSVLKPTLQDLKSSLGRYDVNSLTEKVICIGMRECLQMLKASLTSSNALEDGLRHFLREVEVASAGLFNLGNTCYMNSTLQCLHSVPELKLALMKYSNARRNNDVDEACHNLTIATCHLFNKLDESAKPVTPMQFWMVLREKYPQFN